MLTFMGCPPEALIDEIVEPECGDILLSLDLSGDMLVQAVHSGLLADYRNRGVKVYSVVFDLLPVQMPELFPSGADQIHDRWLRSISTFDGAISISKAVAEDLTVWQAEAGYEFNQRRPFRIGWFHLGSDIHNSAPSSGIPIDAEATIREMQSRPTFLMVGTIEPRKGYEQVINAFDQLWLTDHDINLVIVGHEGWKGLPDEMRRNIPKVIDRLSSHPERGKHLFWLKGISDEYLEKVYDKSSCLIAASFDEGFGLPLIEAAQHKLPIIARDIPVFREVAGQHAFYFEDDFKPDVITAAVKHWLSLYEKNIHPKSKSLKWLAWKESAKQLLDVILNEKQCQTWVHNGILRYYGADSRLGTQVGMRKGHRMVTTGLAGNLIHVPYVALDAGAYRLMIYGRVYRNANKAKVDVTTCKEHQILAEAFITGPDAENCLISLPFNIHVPCNDLEVRMWVDEHTDLSVSLVKIEPYLVVESDPTIDFSSDLYKVSAMNQ